VTVDAGNVVEIEIENGGNRPHRRRLKIDFQNGHDQKDDVMTSISVVNGPKENLLGTRKTEVYGRTTHVRTAHHV
jgi:hypothetical protein